MKIQNVSLVSNRNYGQSFGVSKREKFKENHIPVSNLPSLKSISLATLLAMSPMVNVQAQKEYDYQKDPIQWLDDKVEVVASSKFDGALRDGRDAEIYFISTDGNKEDAEKLIVITKSTVGGEKVINGEKIRYKNLYTNTTYIDTLEVRHTIETYKDNSKPEKHLKDYYIIGYGRTLKDPARDAQNPDRILINNGFQTYKPREELRISKDFYDSLKDLMGDEVEYKETFNKKVVNY